MCDYCCLLLLLFVVVNPVCLEWPLRARARFLIRLFINITVTYFLAN